MALTKRVPVFGSRPPCAYQSRLDYRSARLRADRMERSTSNRPEDFVCYEESDEEESTMSLCTILNSSYNVVDYIRTREYGMREYHSVNQNHWARHMLTKNLYKEQYIPLLKTIDKVFCSQWLSSKQIIFGTKCNKIMVYNVNSRELDQIPLIKGRIDDPENQLSGIYSLKINQSRSLLATGAYNSNEIAVYRLPTLDPIVLAEGAHKDRVYDIEWLDNEFFVSGSRDSGLALWRVQDQYEEQYDADGDLIQPVTQFLSPKVIKRCKWAERVRVITFNKNSKELTALSLNGYVHIWDVERFKQRFSRRLPTCQDTICMSMKSDSSLYAIGCRPYVLLLDSRMLQVIKKVPRKQPGAVMRSLSFQDNIMTIGTGVGVLLFYDIRAGKYLETTQGNTSRVQVLRTSPGYACSDGSNNMENGIQPQKYTPAIYTHCYDFSGIRLFSAGGPLLANMSGNYAGLWQ